MHDLFWDTVNFDEGVASHQKLLSSARVASAHLWPFLSGAQNLAEFRDRKEIATEKLNKVIEAAVTDTNLRTAVRTELDASLEADYLTLEASRKTANETLKCDNCGKSPQDKEGKYWDAAAEGDSCFACKKGKLVKASSRKTAGAFEDGKRARERGQTQRRPPKMQGDSAGWYASEWLKGWDAANEAASDEDDKEASRKTAYGDVFCPYCGIEGCSPNCPGPSGGSLPCPNCGATAHMHNGVLTCDACGEGHKPGSLFDTDPESASNTRFSGSRKTADWHPKPRNKRERMPGYRAGVEAGSRDARTQPTMNSSGVNMVEFGHSIPENASEGFRAGYHDGYQAATQVMMGRRRPGARKAAASNLPPGGGFFSSDDMVPHRCANGHTWDAPMYRELGGWFYVDEDNGPYCPVCGQEDIGEGVEASRKTAYDYDPNKPQEVPETCALCGRKTDDLMLSQFMGKWVCDDMPACRKALEKKKGSGKTAATPQLRKCEICRLLKNVYSFDKIPGTRRRSPACMDCEDRMTDKGRAMIRSAAKVTAGIEFGNPSRSRAPEWGGGNPRCVQCHKPLRPGEKTAPVGNNACHTECYPAWQERYGDYLMHSLNTVRTSARIGPGPRNEDERCWRCWGKGWIDLGIDFDHTPADNTCPLCKGTGLKCDKFDGTCPLPKGHPGSCQILEGAYEAMRKGAPFAGYKDFDSCVAANKDKDDPKAYCGYIKHKTEDKKESAKLPKLSLMDKAAADTEIELLGKTAGPIRHLFCAECGNKWSGNLSKLTSETVVDCPKCGSVKVHQADDLWNKMSHRKTAGAEIPSRGDVLRLNEEEFTYIDSVIGEGEPGGWTVTDEFGEEYRNVQPAPEDDSDERHGWKIGVRKGAVKDCSTCKGSGNCTHCHGSGEVRDDDDPRSCEDCDGSGDCTTCKGAGTVTDPTEADRLAEDAWKGARKTAAPGDPAKTSDKEIELRLVMAVTSYDRQQEKRPGYNMWALPQYIAAVQDVMMEYKAGTDLGAAIDNNFLGRLADVVRKGVGLPKSATKTAQSTKRVQVYLNEGGADAMVYGYKPGDPMKLAIEYDQPGIGGDLDICEDAFQEFNVGHDPTFTPVPSEKALKYRQKRNRSLSVGDVVVIDGTAYKCDFVGFSPALDFTATRKHAAPQRFQALDEAVAQANKLANENPGKFYFVYKYLAPDPNSPNPASGMPAELYEVKSGDERESLEGYYTGIQYQVRIPSQQTATRKHAAACPNCGGTGKCPICGGQQCPDCGYNGECPQCGGTGTVHSARKTAEVDERAAKEQWQTGFDDGYEVGHVADQLPRKHPMMSDAYWEGYQEGFEEAQGERTGRKQAQGNPFSPQNNDFLPGNNQFSQTPAPAPTNNAPVTTKPRQMPGGGGGDADMGGAAPGTGPGGTPPLNPTPQETETPMANTTPVAAKIREIAAGIIESNPSMPKEAALSLAKKTVSKFPNVVAE